MTIATTAPSGNVGRHVVHDLVRAGTRPRALAHRAGSLDDALRDHVDRRVLDLADQEALTDALGGVDALFVTIPSPVTEDPLAEYAGFGRTIAAAVIRAGVARVVLQSSVGAELRHGAGEIDGLGTVEELLEETDAAVLHLRCGFFFTNLVTQADELRGILHGAGLSEQQVEAILGMSTGMRDGFVPEQPRDVTTTTPTTLGAWAHAVLGPLLRAGAGDSPSEHP